MSQHRAVRQRPEDGRPWAPDQESRPTARAHSAREEGDRPHGRAPWIKTPRDEARRDVRRPNTGAADAVIGGGPLTTSGVSVVLVGACVLGGLIDLLLVGTAAWAITGLFIAATVYAAVKVHRQGWYSAVVGPPLAFALGLTVIAMFSPHDMGSGLVGTATTMLELLADKARAVFFGTAAALVIVLVRRLPFSR
jgi:hypothetical protein